MRGCQACLFYIGLLTLIYLASSWDPDAGLVKSLTKSSEARVMASSNSDDAAKANDGNDDTQWTSRGCMPRGFYLDDQLANVFYRACQRARCSSSSEDKTQIDHVTDSSTSTGYQLTKTVEGQAYITVDLSARDSLRVLTVRGVFNGDTQLVVQDGSNEKVVGSLSSADNYEVRDFNVTLTPATAVTLRSSHDFNVHVIGATGSAGCVERIYVDLGAPHPINVIRTRHWAGGHGLSTRPVGSLDGVTWQSLGDLDPNALHAVVTTLSSATSLRYIGVEQRGDESEYAKVYVWEIDAYEGRGLHGGPPTPKANKASLREMLGVNAIWGWGWGRSSTTLSASQGAALYAPIASYARNYHNLNWDVSDPDDKPDYSRMAQGHGTAVQSWLNWDTEYALWVAANVSVHVSVQFTPQDFPVGVWDQPYAAANQYGQAFAQHFGPTHGNGLVKSVEVGNEPWGYPPAFYTTVLDGMATGFKAGDPQMLVMPGAFQAHDPVSSGNYIGTRVTQDVASKIDVINGHHYSWRTAQDGSRVATFPENPSGTFSEVYSMVRWRDANTPDKPLWMTEWGWDSPGGGQDCNKFPECTTEEAASAYAARGLLLHARLDVARSTWFFYGNLGECDDHVFCRSGLTSSESANFAKKGPYYTLDHLLHLLGDTHFLDIIQENEDAYVYLFGILNPSTSLSTATHIVAWRPVDAATERGEVTIKFDYSAAPAHAWKLRMVQVQERETTLPSVRGRQWTMSIDAMPTVVQLIASGLVGKK